MLAREERICTYCRRPAHKGRCREWYRSHPEYDVQSSARVASLAALNERRRRQLNGQTWGGAEPKRYSGNGVYSSADWVAAAHYARDELVRAFMSGGDTGPWTAKLRELLRLRKTGR